MKLKEWLQNLGIADQTVIEHEDEEPDDGAVPLLHEDSVKNRYFNLLNVNQYPKGKGLSNSKENFYCDHKSVFLYYFQCALVLINLVFCKDMFHPLLLYQ